MKLAVIGGRKITAGFALAGVSVLRSCRDEREAEKALKEFAYREDTGIILIERYYADKIVEEVNRFMQIRNPYPLIVIIPSYGGEGRSEDE
ncbi:V-type ATP synthase subunit F [Methanoplanus endosymbiosus]|uniref:V-type ATP synthase subunit F n=1 Tax=Methanoplanus endosymbiosus TaxID=33865 RepID=A0A9E7THD2_9EURY|nr:V-type ATP synthase subunit F [Methanoplanus endosymbiosus]UUX92652.1 V-type ATP synthase subunit F [Methanoplanus endosymbiosus]